MNAAASKKTQKERREETISKVLESACRLFGEKGYDKTSLEDIATDAGITTGPIYHYFDGKQELFSRANEMMESRLLQKFEEFQNDTSRENLRNGWDGFLEACQEPGFIQIVLIDAQHVLGRERWENSPVKAKAYELMVLNSEEMSTSTNPTAQMLAQMSELDRELIMRMVTAALVEAALMVGSHPGYDTRPIIYSILSLLEK